MYRFTAIQLRMSSFATVSAMAIAGCLSFFQTHSPGGATDRIAHCTFSSYRFYVIQLLQVAAVVDSPYRQRGCRRQQNDVTVTSVAAQGDSLPFTYVVGNWSECSVQCGHGGVQSRSVVCTLLGDRWALDVVQSYCDAAVERPINERDCSYVDTCPRWTTADWHQVSFSVCCCDWLMPESLPTYCFMLSPSQGLKNLEVALVPLFPPFPSPSPC